MFGMRLYIYIAILTKNHAISDNLQEECHSDVCPNLNFTQDVPVPENNDHIVQNFQSDLNHSDKVTIQNEVEKVTFSNMSMNLQSIGTIPSEPRSFVEFDRFLNEKLNISATFRWNQPEVADNIQEYTVQCWFIENLKEIQICNDKTILTTKECTEHNLKPNTTYYFRVRARTETDVGPYTDLKNVSTTHENPIPKLLIIFRKSIAMWDVDLKTYVNVFNTFSHDFNSVLDVVYSVAEYKIYWIRDEMKYEYVRINGAGYRTVNDRQLMTWDMNNNNITKITSLNINSHNLCIDWITRNLYWVENQESGHYVMKLDLTMWQINGIAKPDKILSKKNDFYLTIQPSKGYFYWIEKLSDMQFVTMISDLNGKTVQSDIKIAKNMTSCPYQISHLQTHNIILDTTNTEPLIYWIQNYTLIVADINFNTCKWISYEDKRLSKNFQNIRVDKTYIYVYSTYLTEFTSNIYLYVFKKKYTRLNNEKNGFEIEQIQKINNIDNKNFNYFRYITPFGKSLQPYPRMECLTPDKNYTFTIVKVTANSIVLNLPEPIPKRGCKNNLPTTKYTILISYCLNNSVNKSDEFNRQTYERHYEIPNLTPFTEYKLKLALSNFYSDQLSMDLQFHSEQIVRTNESKLNAPENVTVQVLTPTIAAVSWTPPTKLNCATVTYKVYWESISSTNSTQPIKEPFINKRKVDNKFFTIIEQLLPEQKYLVYVRVYPANYSNLYNDSLKIVHMYSEPNITLSGVSINSMNISWIPTINLTIHYILEYKIDEMQKWEIANNSEANNELVMYYIENLLPATLYKFRLTLTYPEYENFTWPPEEKLFTFQTLDDGSSTLAMKYYILLASLAITLVAIVTLICIYRFSRRRKSNNQVLTTIMPDAELTILREVPIGNVYLNTLYSSTLQHHSNKCMLTKIKREQITLTKVLGRGAFGMVFQGIVKDLEESGSETSVAIKTLEKCASKEEKKKFLQEARLMNHFRHEHVLRLLAVCLDENSPLLVLELMENDLQKYLRECQILQPSDLHALRVQDLLAMCEDVARGCCYLEELRFVHRDLACRNCLVSARDRENRIVKIGDFGLARDIYREDYYRKEGEGLLPVRWMAPESIADGIFTSQSDVWSFGVLMWEIASLGEQPYPTRTNLEVMDYVRSGGRLQMPLNCPSSLYQLMQRCWNVVAKDRPNFKLCLNNIIDLRSDKEDAKLHPMNLVGTIN